MLEKGDDLPVAVQVLISQINAAYDEAWRSLQKNDLDDAKDKYLMLRELCQKLGQQQINPLHKQVASHCVTDVYDELKVRLEAPPVSTSNFKTLVVASLLVMVFGSVLFFNPSFSGLAIFESGPPTFVGVDRVTITGPTILDANRLFKVGVNAELGLLATESDDVKVTVQNNQIILRPEPGFRGASKITLIAFNTKQDPPPFVRVPITVSVV